MASQIIPFTPPLTLALPVVRGSVDYLAFRDQFQELDQFLVRTGLESQFVAQMVADWLAERQPGTPEPSARAQARYERHTRLALRCNLARYLLQEDFRGLAVRLADSPVLQQFIGLRELDRVVVPSKSSLQRYEDWCPEGRVRALVERSLQSAHREPAKAGLAQPLDLEAYFIDTTCVKANIHYPVDWVLLRDATLTLMQAVRLIRDQGLKHRMEEPEVFVRRMNGLCIAMTHARTEADNQRKRKRIFRQIDQLVGVVRGHARRYRALLAQRWEKTEWTRGQADQVLGRMDRILALLPRARQQARERILEGQMPANEEKLLSLYEPEARVIVRRKAGAEVEFGNTLFLGENPQGVIVDWELFEATAPGDAKLVVPSLDEFTGLFGRGPKGLGATGALTARPTGRR